MILNDGTDWQPDQDMIEKWTAAYPAVDISAELAKMAAWCDSNPTRRKTKRGISRFCNSWLAKCQDRGGQSPRYQRQRVGVKAMSDLDMLTHDFMDSAAFRDYCLAKYGQFYSHTGERVTA